jgi:hypothetical protein
VNGQVFKQLAREFGIPAALSCIWVILSWVMIDNLSLIGAVNTFCTSFFLISWTFGQYFRVSKQTKTEGNLKRIESNVQSLLTELEKKTEALRALMTGAGSYCRLSAVHVRQIGTSFPEKLIVNLNHNGTHPIYDVSVNLIAIIKRKIGTPGDPMINAKHDLGTITKGTGKEVLVTECATVDGIIIVCVTTSRAGIETNNLLGWRNGSTMEFAYRTERNGEILYVSIPPSIEEPIDWNKFRNGAANVAAIA